MTGKWATPPSRIEQAPSRRHSRAVHLTAVLLVILAGVLLAGCEVRMSLETMVRADGSGVLTLHLSADREIQQLLQEQGAGEDLFADFERELSQEWRVEKGVDGEGTRWITAARDFADPAAFEQLAARIESEPSAPPVLKDVSLTQTGSLLSVRTAFRGTADLRNLLSRVEESADFDPALLQTILRFENRVELPGRVVDSNAEAVEDGVLVWRPGLVAPVQMQAESTAYRWDVIGIIVLGVFIIVGGITAVVLFALRRGRKLAASRAEGPGGRRGGDRRAGLSRPCGPSPSDPSCRLLLSLEGRPRGSSHP